MVNIVIAIKDIIVALLENCIWPAFFMLLGYLSLFKYRENFLKVLREIQEIRIGSFALKLRKAARETDTVEVYNKLSGLSKYELHLFLIFGGADGDKCTYIDQESNMVFQQGAKKLTDLGLINTTTTGTVICFGNTEKGKELHRIFMEQLLKSLE